MINETVITDISHLDFDVDDKIHYQHPTDPTLAWCGEPYPDPLGPDIITPLNQITCDGCREKYMTEGSMSWWIRHGGLHDRTNLKKEE